MRKIALIDSEHHTERALSSDWSDNDFVMVVYDNIILVALWIENFDWT